VTIDESPPLRAREFVAATRATWLLASMFVVHAATVFLPAPDRKIEELGAPLITAMTFMQLMVAGSFVWLSIRVRGRMRAAPACFATAALGVIGLIPIVVIAVSSSGKQGASVLVVVQILLGAAWLSALVFTYRLPSYR
jgi:hypothetical protein